MFPPPGIRQARQSIGPCCLLGSLLEVPAELIPSFPLPLSHPLKFSVSRTLPPYASWLPWNSFLSFVFQPLSGILGVSLPPSQYLLITLEKFSFLLSLGHCHPGIPSFPLSLNHPALQTQTKPSLVPFLVPFLCVLVIVTLEFPSFPLSLGHPTL
jgi:hypothetical protein